MPISSHKNRPPKNIIYIVLVILLALALAITRTRLLGHPADPGPEVYAGVDVSKSHTPKERRRDFGALLAAMDGVLPSRASISIWAFDNNARKCYEGQPSRSSALWKLEDALADYVSQSQGTRPSEALAQMMPGLAEAGRAGRRSVVILAWDGGCEDDKPALRLAVARLAKVPGLCAVWLVGVKSDEALRSDADRIFAPLGLDRLIVSGEFDMAGGLEKLRARLNGAGEVKR